MQIIRGSGGRKKNDVRKEIEINMSRQISLLMGFLYIIIQRCRIVNFLNNIQKYCSRNKQLEKLFSIYRNFALLGVFDKKLGGKEIEDFFSSSKKNSGTFFFFEKAYKLCFFFLKLIRNTDYIIKNFKKLNKISYTFKFNLIVSIFMGSKVRFI